MATFSLSEGLGLGFYRSGFAIHMISVRHGRAKNLRPGKQCLYSVEVSLPDLTKIIQLDDPFL